MYVHGFTSCLNRFPEDGEFVETCLYCVHTNINIHERVGTMHIQMYYIMNMYVYPLFCMGLYIHVSSCTATVQTCMYKTIQNNGYTYMFMMLYICMYMVPTRS